MRNSHLLALAVTFLANSVAPAIAQTVAPTAPQPTPGQIMGHAPMI